jgi:hypothetical protein
MADLPGGDAGRTAQTRPPEVAHHEDIGNGLIL